MKKYTVNKPYEKEVLDKLHRVQVEILRDFDAVCEKHQLHYFAVYGTAIGAVRHGGFIPWDDDVDVAMLREDYEKFLQTLPGGDGRTVSADDPGAGWRLYMYRDASEAGNIRNLFQR